MNKDFDKWNENKKNIDNRPNTVGINEREIWWTSLGLNVGVEIDGKNETFERPVLVLKRFNKDMVWILPTTSQAKDSRFHEVFLFNDKQYFVALTQIRTLSTKRFLRKTGTIPKDCFEKILLRIIGFLQPNENPLKSG